MRVVYRWGFALSAQPCDVRSSLPVGVVLAYQGKWPGAWRGVGVTLLVFTVWVGWHYEAGAIL